MSRKGVPWIAPFWTMRMVPVFSTTNSRPLSSFACCRSTGKFSPLVTVVSFTCGVCPETDWVGGVGEGEVVGVLFPDPPPHPCSTEIEINNNANAQIPEKKG